jgi:peptidoglycan/LPS O-acetylase OafA/YrhL
MFWWTHRYRTGSVPNFEQLGTLSYYALRAVEQFVTFVIPSFLFVSGFFVAAATRRNEHSVSWNIMLARIKNLLIPYIVWSFMMFAFLHLQGQAFSATRAIKMLFLGGAAPPYYYVPLLCQLYLLAPFIVPLARSKWLSLLAFAAAVQLGVASLSYFRILGAESALLQYFRPLTAGWFFPSHCFWFILGIVTGFHLQQFNEWMARLKWGLLALAGLTFLLGMIEWEVLLRSSGQSWLNANVTVTDNLYSLGCLLSFLAFRQTSLPMAKTIDQLGTLSFGIYLAHAPVLEVTSRAIYHVVPSVLAYQTLFQPILLAAGIGIPLLLMATVRRTPPKELYRYLFG